MDKTGYRFFFAAGPGNIIQAHRDWKSGVIHGGQMSVTFSSEFEDLCAQNSAAGYLVSSASPRSELSDGSLRLEHRPKKPARGWRFHVEELRYALSLAWSAKRFQATHAFIQSGSTHYFAMSAFRLLGIRTIPILHNTLWPRGFPALSRVKSLVRWLDSGFFRFFADAVLAVSPECARQVDVLTGGRVQAHVFTIQFDEPSFSPSPPPPLESPIVITFAGRVSEDKGALDLVEIAKRVNQHVPALFHVCGDGPDLERLILMLEQQKLSDVVEVHGWTMPIKLRELLRRSHLAIVPTKSSFNEGMAMTAIEPVLLGRPVITNPVVPALELLEPACIQAETDDVDSYVGAIVNLARDQATYERLCRAALVLRAQFFDRSKSSRAVMQEVIDKLSG